MCTFICYFSFIWKHCYLWINTPNSSTFLFELFYISSFTGPHYVPKTSIKSNFMIGIIIKKIKKKKSARIKLLKNWHSTHVSQISPLTIWEIPPHIICSRVFWWQSWAKMCIVQVFMKSGTPLQVTAPCILGYFVIKRTLIFSIILWSVASCGWC